MGFSTPTMNPVPMNENEVCWAEHSDVFTQGQGHNQESEDKWCPCNYSKVLQQISSNFTDRENIMRRCVVHTIFSTLKFKVTVWAQTSNELPHLYVVVHFIVLSSGTVCKLVVFHTIAYDLFANSL